ncbi:MULTISPECIES: response regulator [Pseudomonas]|jgi:signal transduction histidine kinase/CheY-like chemotaxis protein|uniref:histidine kinase n=1 Tax=Pseudomonas putida S12 TaxID=1215087 RepID=A0AA34RWM9_PSEPU|nr:MULTISPECIES: response regulator [Pseudomonas]ADR61329.1 Histidine kinase [Pseudomonas putida BIRD-1]AJA14954.1 histidine kinase [Pseudomonas putida S12]AOX10427.1 hybrid sensor histidine kinase/response regulator [Pseudomonas putida JB]MDN4516156.1 response regulator [Pseudomonas sp. 2,4-D]PWY43939.1 hybrid sensor histidine kinase/response regulator [Pseudomonas sp. RW405]
MLAQRKERETGSGLMDIKFTNRLSYKQARLTVLVGFILGTLLSLIQIGIDYASEDASINREVNALLQISHNPASRIAYNIDSELALELTRGLLQSPAVIRARLIDNNETVLADVERPKLQDRSRPLSDFLFGEQRQFKERLYLTQMPEQYLGTLYLDIDTFAFGSRFLERAGITLLNGFARSLVLTGLLLALFYMMLTKPLVTVIGALSGSDPRKPRQTRLECPHGHEHDEIGVLVKVANQQFVSMATEIEQRRTAENRLTQYLNELEDIVSARTNELKASNSSLSLSNQELEQARSRALDMAQARAAFLANMSHEIRTPLNGMLGMIALALDNPLPSEQRQQLAIAHDSGKVLVELLNDILDLSKFDAGQLELERIAFDMGSMVEDTANLLSQNTAQSVELTCLIASDFPSSVLGDPTRVRQIVSNLLSNALKFTRFGRVDVRLAAIVGGVRLEVRDTGIGIPEDAQARIFQPFTQAGAGITRQYGGTGLGLALTRNLCKAMQGHLHIRSEPGFGSSFTAELPLTVHTEAIPPAPLHGRVAALSAAGSGLNELLQHLLPAWGLTYQRHDSYATLDAAVVDLLITDDVEHLFELRPALKTPILLVTAYGNFLPNEQSLALAPLHQLARPLARNALYQTLRRTLQGHEPEHPLAIPVLTQEQGRARILLVEDNPVNQLVAKGMLAKLGCQVQLATQGAEALELLAREEFDLVLMDCNMPVMDGYEASRRIRQSGRWPELPIVALTANAMPEERERCRAAGMNDYLAKPFRREELLALVDHWVPFSG